MKVAQVKESDIQEAFERVIEELEKKYWSQTYHSLPAFCEECRQLNDIQNTELERNGNKKIGIGIDSKSGWSKEGHMFQGNSFVHPRWRGIIPKALKFAMMTLTDNDDFWSPGNKKEWHRFVRYCVFEQTLDPRHFLDGYWKKRLNEQAKIKVGFNGTNS